MNHSIAPNSQTWWDAFCNLQDSIDILPISKSVMSDKQYSLYADTEFASNRSTDGVFLADLTPEEASTYFLFMHHAFDPKT